MANLIKTLESGAKIEVQVASFEKAHRLLQAVKSTLIGMENIIELVVSEPVQPALWDCMSVVLYNGQRVSRETFEPENARGDYLVVAIETLKANITPFFKSLASSSKAVPPGQTSVDQMSR